MGKWLANVNAVRKMPLTTRFSYLEWLASGGEGVYYFVEQFTWSVYTFNSMPSYTWRISKLMSVQMVVGK